MKDDLSSKTTQLSLVKMTEAYLDNLQYKNKKKLFQFFHFIWLLYDGLGGEYWIIDSRILQYPTAVEIAIQHRYELVF